MGAHLRAFRAKYVRMVAAAAVALVLGAVAAQAASAKGVRVVAPKQDALITGKAVRVEVRGVGPGFSAVVGSSDVGSRFRASHHGHWRTAVLRRGRDLRVGTNRLSVASGRGAGRRIAARSFMVGRRAHGILRLRRRWRSRSLSRVRIGQPKDNRGAKSFEAVAVRINGRLVRTRDWALGHHVSSSLWPLGRRSFDAMFGSDDGLRHGRNRLTVTAWRQDGTYDRASLSLRVGRSTPLISAGRGARTAVGRRVELHGRTSAPAGHKVGLQWRIVRAPRGSHARLRHARSARPSLVPDKPGRYRVRLVARAHRRPAGHRSVPPAFTGAASGGGVGEAVDEATVDAVPDVPPIGEQVQTITAGGAVKLGDQTYHAGKGAWAQMLVLDAGTLEVESNQSFGAAADVTAAAVNSLDGALTSLDDAQIAVVSGGDRPASFASDTAVALSALFADLGQLGDAYNWGDDVPQNLSAGKWSLIGNPQNASGTANLYGLRYGLRAGQWSPAGAVTGYLQENLHVQGTSTATSYGFASANVSSIDTNVPGAPAGVNEIRAGSQTYSSQKLRPGYSGFHLLVLDEWLTERENSTFVTNGPADADVDPHATANLAQAVHDATLPGNLVIVQSIGHPFGYQPSWLDDNSLAGDTFGENVNVPVPRAPSTWAASGQQPDGTGSLASELGLLGGAVAHDQVAELNTFHFNSTNLHPDDGYTLVAAAGQLTGYDTTQSQAPEPVFPSSVPVSRVQLPKTRTPGARRPPARIVGTLSRDRQSLWKVDTPSALSGPQGAQIRRIAYEPPSAWPASGSAADEAANSYIAHKLGLKAPDGQPLDDVRDAYDQTNATQWSNRASTVAGYDFPGTGHGFNLAAFDAVKTELHTEMLDVSNVWSMIDGWQQLFGKARSASSVGLQTLAAQIEQYVTHLHDEAQAQSQAAYIAGDVLWIAADVASLGGGDELGSALSGLSGGVDMSADTSTDASGAPSAEAVNAEARQIGPEVAERYTNIATNMGILGEILVSDWHKLQQSSEIGGSTPTGIAQFRNALTNSAYREFSKALLSAVYGVYAVDPPWVTGKTNDTLTRIACTRQTGIVMHENFHPFTNDSFPGSWQLRPVLDKVVRIGRFRAEEGKSEWFGFVTKASYGGGATLKPGVHVLPVGNTTIGSSSFVPGSDFLFTPLSTGGSSLGMDRTVLLADSRFTRWWWWCNRP